MSKSLIQTAPRRHRRTVVAPLTFVVALAAAVLLSATAQARPHSAHAGKPCTPEQGQQLIDTGRYKQAIGEFTCVIAAQPTGVEGFRGRIEAELLAGRFSDAAADHARVTAKVLPVHPDAHETILAGYDDRLSADPEDIAALTGASFAHCWFFDYAPALDLLEQLVAERPNDLYGNLLRGSNRMFLGIDTAAGEADLERAIQLAPKSPDVRWVVADAYTYAQPDSQRAFTEATHALDWGLDTPRIHAILANAYMAFGDQAAAAAEIKTHIDQVTA